MLWFWLLAGWTGFLILPWYQQEYGFWTLEWLTDGYPFYADYAPAILQATLYDRGWLLPLAIFLILPLALLRVARQDRNYARILILSGMGGLVYLLVQGFAIGISGWGFGFLESLFGPLDVRQYGLGYGALFCAASFLVLLCTGLAAAGAMRGDVFVTSAIGVVVALVAVFVFFPVSRILVGGFVDYDGALSGAAFARNFFNNGVWGVGCLSGGYCGVAWNTAILAILTATSTTLLGLTFALVVTRTAFRWKKSLRVLTVLPIITPPFVIGLALILLFGRSGAATQFFSDLLGVEAGRWLYGLPGIWLAQTLSFTPISFLVLIGVVEGVSPSMEEASQTLRANRWQTFTQVSLPLMRPGLANAFLLSFIESMADFGNPMVLGGNYDVLSTEIFFAIVGAQNDQGRAAVLAVVLLFFTLSAFAAQRFWLGRKSYATVSGKADNGAHVGLNRGLKIVCYATVIPWAIFTVVIYAMIFYGGFVRRFGFDNSLTLANYRDAFGVAIGDHGIVWSGAAWDSLWTTISISAIAAPLTAIVGLTTAYLLVRQNFRGKNAFEFGTMLSFAIPGTVIGVSYILAFNVPPLELTGTGVILVICFIFRNMPVGVRGGIAAMSQLDRSLDEASLTLGANSFTTFRRVILPLLRPAIVAALVYSFVRAITSVSAVIFLVSADHNMATSYIIGLVENGRYGVAIAYCSVLIVVMLAAIVSVQLAVGKRRLRREDRINDTDTDTGANGGETSPILREKRS
ncbi:iron ABC transporter permease [Thalassospira sp.]|uniref:ABC transporter permease n=1 Tax=Thalassospira sp. TaxID=1912094 RepID=UPI0027336EF1|nr:iron ABC transporter permease [Thalassospira sp.]MDP2697602.1 iron ABC transporter permease [Thalassospira sp.]